jgi:hypothetical protein
MDHNSEYWEKKQCQWCGKVFWVRKCYTRRGQGKYCSTSCSIQFRNKYFNPTRTQEVRDKISKNHADVSGENNPMYGVRGKDSPGWIDGRNSSPAGEEAAVWRKVALMSKPPVCEECGKKLSGRDLQVHHKDGYRSNNDIDNLMVVCSKCHNTVLHRYERDENGRFTSRSEVKNA